MAITYPLSLPTTKSPKRISFSQRSFIGLSTSPFTGHTQVFEHQGQTWGASITLPVMERADAEEWQSFILQLNGQFGTFLLGPWSAGDAPRGVATGTPLVNGASQTGQELITDGWTTGVTGILLAGDWIQIGQRLYKVMVDVDSDGSGNATLDIWPRLRESPADNDTIITADPLGLFRLNSNQNVIFEATGPAAGPLYTLSFSAIEAI